MAVTLAAPNVLGVSLRLQEKRGSDGYIKGIVTEGTNPVARRVMCYHRRTGVLINTTLSDSAGGYRFDNLIAGVKYFVTSVDENNDAVQYNAVTQDLITASEV